MITLGFLFGILFGALYFENFSCKNPKNLEEAELLVTHFKTVKETEEKLQPKAYSWS